MLASADNRLRELEQRAKNRKSSQKKASLSQQLNTFLTTLPVPRTLDTCQPRDILRFLAVKDEMGLGKTQVHHLECSKLGCPNIETCGCPVRLSAEYVKHMISDIRVILSKHGRGHVWDPVQQQGNPACSMELSTYLSCIKEEQAEAHVSVKQAIPMSLEKLNALILYLTRELDSDTLPRKEVFMFLRDRAFFLIQFVLGERAGDLCKLLLQQIFRCPDNKGLVLRQTFGKMRAERHCVLPHSSGPLCPVQALDIYIKRATAMGLDMSTGYVFRKTLPTNNVVNTPLSQSGVNQRLVLHLTNIGRYHGETTHSLRSGCAVALKVTEHSSQAAAAHIGWKSKACWEHYSRTPSFQSTSVAQTVTTLLKDVQEYNKVDGVYKSMKTQSLHRAYP